MTQTEKIILLLTGGILIYSMTQPAYLPILDPFLEQWERFSAAPYWDQKQWSWGFGTRVPGSVDDPNQNPGGTITPLEAIRATHAHVKADYTYLKPRVAVKLNPRQWAAYLSFSYNLGPGNADNLLPDLNVGNLDALGAEWNEYINSGGHPNSDLIARRAAEWELFNS